MYLSNKNKRHIKEKQYCVPSESSNNCYYNISLGNDAEWPTSDCFYFNDKFILCKNILGVSHLKNKWEKLSKKYLDHSYVSLDYGALFIENKNYQLKIQKKVMKI